MKNKVPISGSQLETDKMESWSYMLNNSTNATAEQLVDDWIKNQHGTAGWEAKLKQLVSKILSDQLNEIEATVNASPQPTMHHELRKKIAELKGAK